MESEGGGKPKCHVSFFELKKIIEEKFEFIVIYFAILRLIYRKCEFLS